MLLKLDRPIFLFALVTVGCLFCTRSGLRNDAGGEDAQSEDAADRSDVPASHDSLDPSGGRYMAGHVSCCAKGEGAGCCDGGRPSPICQPYGGIYRDCRAAGEMYEGKVSCARCCPGLIRVSPTVPVADGGPAATCESTAPDSVLICINCGDGICGEGENSCRCPQDCPNR